MPSYSGVWTLTAQYQAKGAGNWPLPPLSGDIGLFVGADSNIIDYITITSTGNATDFGDVTTTGGNLAACASTTRGVFAGGVNINVIEYVTFSTIGNTTDFGDLTVARGFFGGANSSTRGVFMAGRLTDGTTYRTIDYITIASTGNATSFGLISAAAAYNCCLSNATREVIGTIYFDAGGNSKVLQDTTAQVVLLQLAESLAAVIFLRHQTLLITLR